MSESGGAEKGACAFRILGFPTSAGRLPDVVHRLWRRRRRQRWSASLIGLWLSRLTNWSCTESFKCRSRTPNINDAADPRPKPRHSKQSYTLPQPSRRAFEYGHVTRARDEGRSVGRRNSHRPLLPLLIAGWAATNIYIYMCSVLYDVCNMRKVTKTDVAVFSLHSVFSHITLFLKYF